MFTEYRKIDKLGELKTSFKENKKRFTRFEFLKTMELKVHDCVSTGRESCVQRHVYQSTRLTNPQDLHIQKAVYAVHKSKLSGVKARFILPNLFATKSCEYGHQSIQ
jgi:hypothetical protein